MSQNRIRYINLVLILVFNLFLYYGFISVFYGFISDDYCLLGLIKENPGKLISTNTGDPYYLYSRPFSYFTHWCDYFLLGVSATGMKYLSFLYLSVFLVFFYLLLEEIASFTDSGKRPSLFLFLSMMVSTNIMTVLSVVWISERNQILMMLFYVLSAYLFLKYLNASGKKYFLILSLLFFLFSLLSKQQSAHLPFVAAVFVIIYKDKIGKESMYYIKIWLISSLLLSIGAIFYFSFNQNLYSDIVIANLWKKPYFFVSSVLYAVFPFAADNLYVFFVENKYIVAWISYPIAVLIILFLLFRKIRISRKMLLAAILYMLTGFPIIFLSMQARLLQPQLLVLSIFPVVLPSKHFNKNIVYPVLAFLILMNIVFSGKSVGDLQDLAIRKEKSAVRVNDLFDHSGKKKLIILNNDFDYACFPYEMFFQKNGTYGKLNDVYFTPLAYNSIKSFDYCIPEDSNAFTVNMTGDTLTFNSCLNNVVFYTENISPDIDAKFCVTSVVQDRNKSYRSVSLRLPVNFKKDEFVCLFFDGKDWEVLNL